MLALLLQDPPGRSTLKPGTLEPDTLKPDTLNPDTGKPGEHDRIAVALHGTLMRPGGLTAHQVASMWESDAKVLPIRFPAKAHEQLKAWCEEHNFPMAAVVRGLVDRFLETQQLP